MMKQLETMQSGDGEMDINYINIATACEIFNVTRATIHSWRYKGMKCKKIDRVYHYRVEDLQTFFDTFSRRSGVVKYVAPQTTVALHDPHNTRVPDQYKIDALERKGIITYAFSNATDYNPGAIMVMKPYKASIPMINVTHHNQADCVDKMHKMYCNLLLKDIREGIE